MKSAKTWIDIVRGMRDRFDYDTFLSECGQNGVDTMFTMERYVQIVGIVYYYMSKGQSFDDALTSFSTHKSKGLPPPVPGNPGVVECGSCGGGRVR